MATPLTQVAAQDLSRAVSWLRSFFSKAETVVQTAVPRRAVPLPRVPTGFSIQPRRLPDDISDPGEVRQLSGAQANGDDVLDSASDVVAAPAAQVASGGGCGGCKGCD